MTFFLETNDSFSGRRMTFLGRRMPFFSWRRMALFLLRQMSFLGGETNDLYFGRRMTFPRVGFLGRGGLTFLFGNE